MEGIMLEAKMKTRISWILALLVMQVLACGTSLGLNEDGSLTVETRISPETLRQVIETSLKESEGELQNVTVDLHDEFILVAADRPIDGSGGVNHISFQLELSVNNGSLAATASEAQIDGVPVDQAAVDLLNQRIASQLSQVDQQVPNAILESVSVSPEGVDLTWRVTPP
jgi:hypothetical protein